MASEARLKIVFEALDLASKEIKQLGGSLKEVEKETKSSNQVLKELGKTAAVAGVAIVATGVAIKKAFDLGREGAAIRQTGESFDFLLQKVGLAPDLLNQLSVAAGGTVSDMELMSSTATLLAGANDQLATSLGNATPQLLEIAKAANKLNPSLGSTTFLYDSLARGIKRSSPLILDNLGIVTKIGEANKIYAAQLGKTVEQLTSTEKQQALLNDVLRAGNTLIEQVGGNVDAATDSYDRLSAGIANSTDRLKANFSEGIEPLMSGLANYSDFLVVANDAIDAGVVSRLEMQLWMAEIAIGTKTYADATEELVSKIESQDTALQRTTAEMQRYEQAATAASTSIASFVGIDLDNLLPPPESVADRFNEIMAAMDIGVESDTPPEIALGVNEGIFTENLSGMLTSLAGSEAFGGIPVSFDAEEGLSELEIRAAQLEIDLPIQVDQTPLEEIQSALDRMNTTKLDDAEGNITDGIVVPTGLAASNISQLSSTLAFISGRAWDIEVNILTSGTIPVVPQASGGPLADVALVGEQGQELIINGVVVPHNETQTLLGLGLTPNRTRAFGGPLTGGGSTDSTFVDDSDFDPNSLDDRTLLKTSTSSGGSRTRTSTSTSSGSGTGGSTGAAVATATVIANVVEEAVTGLIPTVAQATVAAVQTQAALQAQSQRQFALAQEENLQLQKELLDRVDELIQVNTDIAPNIGDQIVKLNE